MRVILLLFLAIFIYAKTMMATYTAKYGWFGTIAEATGVYEYNKTNYKITAQTKTKGIVASFSKHLSQTYISEGIVKNNILIPKKYTLIIKRGDNIYKRVYKFDRKNKKIIKIRFKNSQFQGKETLKYYVSEDVLSLYFNLPNYLKTKKQKIYTFYAIGGRKSDGRIDVTFPTGNELKNIKDEFDNKKGLYIKANLYNKVFAGDKGILYLVIDPKNWVTLKGVVKNVLKIGDLKGGIKNFKLIP